MSIQVNCPSRDCDQTLSLSPDMAGKKGKCPKCGKSFQIPKNLGGSTSGKTSSSASTGGNQPAAGSASRPRPQRGPEKVDADEFASMLVDDDEPGYAEEVVDDYEEYDPAPRRRPPRRGRRDDDYEDDYRDDGDDYYEPRRRGGGGGLSKNKRWKLTSVGMLIVAISMCVFGGAFVFTMLSEMLFQIAMASTKLGMLRAAGNVFKIAQVFAMLAGVGLIVGYVFSVFAPNKYASLGLAIAALVLGIANFVLQLIFVQIPVLGDKHGHIYCRSIHAGWIGGIHPGADEVLSFFLELGIVAEFLLFSLFLAAIARSQGNRQHKVDCMRIVWFLAGFCGLLLFMYIFMFIGDMGSGKWLYYIVRILNWLGNGLLGTVLVFYILNLFYSAKSTG